MRILLTGSKGQVGSALVPALAPLGEVFAVDRAGLDLLDADAIRKKIKELKPAIIVNAAAYTAVDRAEIERETVFAVNATAVRVLAEEARKLDALLVHFSTDYVFDGEKRAPYVESDAPAPLSVYGHSKLEGERAIAAAIARILSSPEAVNRPNGVYNLSAAGQTSWFGFAKEILAEKKISTPIVPIGTDEFPVAARRPKNSLLDNSKIGAAFGIALPDWRQGLPAVLAAIH